MNQTAQTISIDRAAGADFTAVKAYRPVNLPWTAKRKGVNNLVWYTIFDSNGDEMCGTGSELLENERGMLAQVFLILTSVNGGDTVEIDGNKIKVDWR
jgi:hypothetical protein